MKQTTVYYTIRFVLGFSIHMMFLAAGLYRIDVAELAIYQLILIGTALEIAIFVFEVPTGLVADIKSRKLSVMIGLFIISIGIIIEPFTRVFAIIFLAQVIFGFGYTFISGALDAWISDEVKLAYLERTIINGAQLYKVSTILGVVLTAITGMFDIRIPLFISSILILFLAIFSIMTMRETHFQKKVYNEPFYRKYYQQLKSGFGHIKHHHVLRTMFVIMLFYGLYSEGIDRTHELYILDYLGFRGIFDLPAIWVLSIISIVISLMGFVMLHILKKHVNQNKMLFFWSFQLTFVMMVGILVFAYMNHYVIALLGFMTFSVSREGTYPLLNTILLKNTPSKIKATVLSSFGQLDAIGQLLSGGLMVIISLWLDIPSIYLVTTLLLFVPFILLIKLYRHESKKELKEVNDGSY